MGVGWKRIELILVTRYFFDSKILVLPPISFSGGGLGTGGETLFCSLRNSPSFPVDVSQDQYK